MINILASNALGYDIDEQQVQILCEYYKDVPTIVLKSKLITLEKEFSNKGARGIYLADSIDELKIVLSVR